MLLYAHAHVEKIIRTRERSEQFMQMNMRRIYTREIGGDGCRLVKTNRLLSNQFICACNRRILSRSIWKEEGGGGGGGSLR